MVTIYHDLQVLKKQKKVILFFIIVLLAGMIGTQGANYPKDFRRILGLEVADYLDMLALVYYLFSISFYCYIAITLFINDFKRNLDHLFLRINSQRFLIQKLVFLLLFVTVMNIISFTLLQIVTVILHHSFFDTWQYLAVSILFQYSVAVLFLFLFTLFCKTKLWGSIFTIFLIILYSICPFIICGYHLWIHLSYLWGFIGFIITIMVIFIVYFPYLFVRVAETV